MSLFYSAQKPKNSTWTWRLLRVAASAAVESPNNLRRFSLNLASAVTLAAGITAVGCEAAWQSAEAEPIPRIDARVIAVNVPGASAISQVGTFLNVPPPGACANPIPTKFPGYIQPGAVLDPNRILVGSRSNFGAPLATLGVEGSFLSIDPNGPVILQVPLDFAQSGVQASAFGGAVQMFSANSPSWYNSIKNSGAYTASYTGVSNPLGLSNNNAFGRIWPANAPFGESGVGSSSILDPTGLPLAGAPNPLIGGVYVGNLTNRNLVASPPQLQVIPGSLKAGAVGTALLGPSPDGTCKAVFAVVTADGAIVQEHTLKGLDGVAPAGTVRPLLDRGFRPEFGRNFDHSRHDIEPRLGVLMNPYAPGVVRQLFVSEPFDNTIAVINLVVFGTAPNQVFGLGAVSRIRSDSLNFPVDLAAAQRDADNVNWASNTTLDNGSDLYVANRGNNSIVRMRQDGSVVSVRRVIVGDDEGLGDARLNGITTSTDGRTIYVTFTGPERGQGGVLALPAFGSSPALVR
jgi:hypothetical protein